MQSVKHETGWKILSTYCIWKCLLQVKLKKCIDIPQSIEYICMAKRHHCTWDPTIPTNMLLFTSPTGAEKASSKYPMTCTTKIYWLVLLLIASTPTMNMNINSPWNFSIQVEEKAPLLKIWTGLCPCYGRSCRVLIKV